MCLRKFMRSRRPLGLTGLLFRMERLVMQGACRELTTVLLILCAKGPFEEKL